MSTKGGGNSCPFTYEWVYMGYILSQNIKNWGWKLPGVCFSSYNLLDHFIQRFTLFSIKSNI